MDIKRTCSLAVLFIAFCGWTACNQAKEDTGFKRIEQNKLKETGMIGFGDNRFFKNCFLVRLETNDDCLIAQIDQIEIHDEQIYILDIKKTQIMVFDFNGKYLHSIGSKGNGPKEYLHISTFFIDKEMIHLFDPANNAVIQYKTSGAFHARVNTDYPNMGFIRKVIPANSKELFAYSATNWVDNAVYSLLDRENFTPIRHLRHYPAKPDDYISYQYAKQPFAYFDNAVTFSILFSDTLFTYKQKETIPETIIQNNKPNLPSELLVKRLTENDGNYSSVISKINSENTYNTGLMNIFENSRFLLCDFRSGHCMDAVLYDKHTREGWLINEYCHYFPDFGNFITSNRNTLVRLWDYDAITAFKAALEKNAGISDRYPKHIMEAIRQYNDEEDNPMLIFFEFKE